MFALDDADVLLLDLNGTFMFGQDRFSPTEDYAATYRHLGGTALPDNVVRTLVQACIDTVQRHYDDPARLDNFPSLREVLCELVPTELGDAEIDELARVFAHHELGTISPEYAECLHALARRWRLGLVSNLWSPKDLWLGELRRAGVHDLFDVLVFSSDTPSIKPSPRLFEKALAAYPHVPRRRVFHAGDSLRCDVEGARAAGLRTIWIANRDANPGAADMVIPSLLALAANPARTL